jgi:hypothetical protein
MKNALLVCTASWAAVVATAAPSCEVQATPLPLKLVEERIATGRAPFGMWTVAIACKPGARTEFSGESLVVAIGKECQRTGQPHPLFLPKEVVGPVLLRKAGGRLSRIAMYAGPAASISSGIPWLAAIAPLMDLFGRAAGTAVPSIADLALEIPPMVQVPETGGKTLLVWSAKMRKTPQVIGPFQVGE